MLFLEKKWWLVVSITAVIALDVFTDIRQSASTGFFTPVNVAEQSANRKDINNGFTVRE
ncbi:hypothetical protein [Endozoicomonas sp. OPT23]|uniref:hypothetical protein n=1 Tax=Endozoicomonas sp. OPT23 TaxID=2072845 RepID=UPI00129A39D6|nr:hypothetical protein [Endozoicomonas sp. OPT23]